MSEVTDSKNKKQSCGDMHHIKEMLRDVLGGLLNLQVVGTDPDVGVIDGATLTDSYSPASANKNPDGTFLICIESVGIFFVSLADGSDFIITAAQSTAYLGQWYPAKILSVNVDTTGSFSVGY